MLRELLGMSLKDGRPDGPSMPSESPRRSLKAVQRAAYAQTAPVQHVRVDHGGSHARVAEQFLDSPDVIAIVQEVRREGMAEGVAGRALGDA
jgi:hypothetical protein